MGTEGMWCGSLLPHMGQKHLKAPDPSGPPPSPSSKRRRLESLRLPTSFQAAERPPELKHATCVCLLQKPG